IPFNGPLSEAAFKMPLISSRVVSRFGVNVRSTRLPLGVGTRIAEPSSLPFSSGSTSPPARPAPDVVGMRDIAAARARRLSLIGRAGLGGRGVQYRKFWV